MATISGASLQIVNNTNTTVNLTVKYTLTPNAVERLAGTVFAETIQIIGDDPGVLSDVVISTFAVGNYAVSTTTPSVMRTRTVTLLKSQLNEDALFAADGSELADEVFAKITLAYVANAPIPAALPAPASTPVQAGAWK